MSVCPACPKCPHNPVAAQPERVHQVQVQGSRQDGGVMNGTTVTATIADLDEMLANSTYDRCCVKTLARILLVMPRRTSCQRAAHAVVIVTCSEHGPDTWAVCGKHLRAIRRRPWLLRCGTCRRPASLEGAEGA